MNDECRSFFSIVLVVYTMKRVSMFAKLFPDLTIETMICNFLRIIFKDIAEIHLPDDEFF